MSALGIDGKSIEYLVMANRVETLQTRYIRICGYAPKYQLDELSDEISRLSKEKDYLWRRDHSAVPLTLEMERY